MLWKYIKKLSKYNNNYDQFEVERVKKRTIQIEVNFTVVEIY